MKEPNRTLDRFFTVSLIVIIVLIITINVFVYIF
jgi:hypothetical protein